MIPNIEKFLKYKLTFSSLIPLDAEVIQHSNCDNKIFFRHEIKSPVYMWAHQGDK